MTVGKIHTPVSVIIDALKHEIDKGDVRNIVKLVNSLDILFLNCDLRNLNFNGEQYTSLKDIANKLKNTLFVQKVLNEQYEDAEVVAKCVEKLRSFK